MKRMSSTCICGAVTFAAAAAFGVMKTDAPVSDHAVFQSGEPIVVCGIGAAENRQMTCTFAGQTVRTYSYTETFRLHRRGEFRFVLPPQKPGGPYEMVITNEAGGAALVIKDIMVGEVWIAGGQSNMQFEMQNAREPYVGTNRMLRVFRGGINGTWDVATTDSLKRHSAEGTFFGDALQRSLGGAVGIYDIGVGGTYLVDWMSRGAARACPAARILLDDFDCHQGDPERWAQKLYFEYDEPERTRVQKNPPPPEKHEKGWNPWGDASPWSREYRWRVHRNFRPTEWFQLWAMPLIDYPVRGVVWHQGESEAWASPAVAAGYGEALKALIADWRHLWGEPDLPFGIVRLHDYYNGSYDGEHKMWKVVRDQQDAVGREVPHCGTIDIDDIAEKGGDVHFKNKRPVGERLAAWALKEVYRK